LKPDEAEKPFYARTVTHSLSVGVVWLLQTFSLTPNQFSCFALFLAILSFPFFVFFTPLSILLGALSIEGYYVFDAVDGQWARFKNQKSLTGAFLDYLSNYAIHPPLIFAIAWGSYSVHENPLILLFGFLGGISCLWIILIWNLRASILLDYLKSKQQSPAPSKYGKSQNENENLSPVKKLFSFLHKTFIFPWFMNILTILSLISFILKTPDLLTLFVIYLGTIGPLMAIAITTHWILTRKLDHAPELLNNRISS